MFRISYSNKNEKRYLIVTGGLSPNKGDQAIMEVSEKLYKKFFSDVHLTFENPFPGLTSLVQSIFRVFSHNAILINVGHPIQDTTSQMFIVSVFWRLVLGLIVGKQVGMMAGGVSELHSRLLRRLVVWVLNRSVIVSVRDADSAERLQRWGVTKTITVAADPAFLLSPMQTERTDVFLQNLPPGPLVAFAPRRWFHYKGSLLPVRRRVKHCAIPEQAIRYQEALITAINYVVEELDGTAVLVCMSPGSSQTPGQDDDIFANEIITQVSRPDRVILMPISFTPAEIKYCLRYFDLLIGVRMHATIFALSSMIPCINIYYNEKGLSLFRHLKLEEYTISIDSCHSESIIYSIREIWPRLNAVRNKIAENIEEIKRVSQKPYDILSITMSKN